MRSHPKSQRAIAKKWGVSALCVQRWEQRGLPVRDDRALAQVLLRSKTSPSVRIKATDILKGGVDLTKDSEAVVEAALKLRRNALDAIADLERYQAYYKAKTDAAIEQGNPALAEQWIKSYGELALKAVRIRKELFKMGEESGNTLSKAQVRNILGAIGSRSALAIGRLNEELAKSLAGTMSLEDISNRVQPALVAGLFFEPFRAAATQAAGCGLPGWVVDTLRETLGDYIEEGEKEFDEGQKEEA